MIGSDSPRVVVWVISLLLAVPTSYCTNGLHFKAIFYIFSTETRFDIFNQNWDQKVWIGIRIFPALVKFLRVVKADIDREKKGKAGVENLARALQETPKFGSEDSQQDVQEKLQHMRSMLTFLESCRLVNPFIFGIIISVTDQLIYLD